jgi:hypothetical protein
MTTPARQKLYEAQHEVEMEGKNWAVYNPNNRPLNELPKIFGFNNGGPPGWMAAQLVSEDGVGLGSHICSSEAYMKHDLGILEGTRPDRHEGFREYYPNGYRMVWVPTENIETHPELQLAFERNKNIAKEEKDL